MFATRSFFFTCPILFISLLGCGEPGAPPTAGQAPVSLSQPFAHDDVLLDTGQFKVGDHEFDHNNKRIVFKDGRTGWVVIASIDGDGDLVKGSHVVVDDSGEAVGSFGDLPIGNGPEWGAPDQSQAPPPGPLLISNPNIYYLRRPDKTAAPYMARAVEGPGNTWTLQKLNDGEWRGPVIASYDYVKDVPLLLYSLLPDGTPYTEAKGYWREDGSQEHLIPGFAYTSATGGSPARFIPGKRELVMTVLEEDSKGKQWMALTRLKLDDTNQTDVIARYPAASLTSIGVVTASGYNDGGEDAFVFYGILDTHRIEVYLSTGWGKNKYMGSLRPQVDTSLCPSGVAPSPAKLEPVVPPGCNIFLLDDENFELDGEPYITITMGSTRKNPPASSEIWFAWAFAGSQPSLTPPHGVDYRKVSVGDPRAKRNDPEPLTTSKGYTYIYYRQHTGRAGLHRAATGLPPVGSGS